MTRSYVDEGRVNIGAFVAPSLKRSLVELAYRRRETVSSVIRSALAEEINRELVRRRHGSGLK